MLATRRGGVAAGYWPRHGDCRRVQVGISVLVLVLAGWLSLVVSSARAAPILYTVTSGSATVEVLVGGISIGKATNVGVSGSVTVDAGVLVLDSLNLSLAPNISLTLSTPYGGFDQITIEAASLTSDLGFGSVLPPVPVSPSTFGVYVGSLTVSGSWAAADSGGVNPSVSGIPITYPVPALSAVVSTAPLLNVQSVTLTALNGADFGESQDLVVLANFAVFAIPEPGTGLLAGLGLALLAASRRRRRGLAA